MLEHQLRDITGDACSDGVLVHVWRQNSTPESANQQDFIQSVDFGPHQFPQTENGVLKQWLCLLLHTELTEQLGLFITKITPFPDEQHECKFL